MDYLANRVSQCHSDIELTVAVGDDQRMVNRKY
jgi:hypothetical protein